MASKAGRGVSARGPSPDGRQEQSVSIQQVFEGPLPSPDTLFAYDRYLPGTADRIIGMAEREQAHRINQEDMQTRADIRHRDEVVAAQRANAKGVFASDMFGQAAGAFIGVTCVLGAIYLALQPGMSPWIPVALVSLPVASIINAIRQKKDQSGKK